MNCDKYDELIHSSLDGDLNSSEESVLNAHLDTCEDCMMKYEELKLLKEVLSEEPLLELPDGFEEELHQRLVNEEKPKKPSFFARRVVQNGAIGLVAAALVVTIMLPTVLDRMPNMGYKAASMEMATDDDMKYGSDTNMEGAPMDKLESPAPASAVTALEMNDSVAVTFNEELNTRDNYTVKAEVETQLERSETDNLNVNERKVIKNGEISLEITDYDIVFESIVMMTEEAGGYVQNSNEWLQRYNRYSEEDPLKAGNINIRIPADTFSLFIEQMKNFGVVTNSYTYANDVSYQYRNAVSEVQNLEVTERSLRELMQKAEDIDDIIYIERELMRVRGEINMYMGNIKQWDDLAAMSTLNIGLVEVEVLEGEIKPVDESLWTKAQKRLIDNLNGLTRFGEGFVIWFVATLPMFLIFGISAWVVYKLLKWLIKKIFK